jgi:hypothetical protein
MIAARRVPHPSGCAKLSGMPARMMSPTFVGRRVERSRLEGALERVAAGEASIVLVGGEAGIGKTRLLTEFLATDRDAVVLSGGAWTWERRRCRTHRWSRRCVGSPGSSVRTGSGRCSPGHGASCHGCCPRRTAVAFRTATSPPASPGCSRRSCRPWRRSARSGRWSWPSRTSTGPTGPRSTCWRSSPGISIVRGSSWSPPTG